MNNKYREFYIDCYNYFNKLCTDFNLSKTDLKSEKLFKNDYSSQTKFINISSKEETELEDDLNMFFAFHLHTCKDIHELEKEIEYLTHMNNCIRDSFVIFNTLQGNRNSSFESYSGYISYCTKLAKKNKGWREYNG